MREPDQFDEFYKDVRTRLLLLTYCLTGDLPSSRAAVRESFVVAWHHWRKISRLEDPESWARERASRHAQRRHTAKLWHREKGLDPEVKETLTALGHLSFTQRRVLLITELTTVSLAEMAREVGITRAEAERELQVATSQFSLHRETPTISVRTVLEAVLPHLEGVRWPRATIIRRAGTTRRRTHTVLGVAAATATLVVAGSVVSDTTGARPTLAGERIEGSSSPSTTPTPAPVDLPEDALLDVTTVADSLSATGWTVLSTDDNTEGDGLVMTCQRDRYADERADAALVRRFDPIGKSQSAFTQAATASRNERAAGRAYDTTVSWFAGCGDDRAQLAATYELPGVGDEAVLLELRTSQTPAKTVLAGVARSGSLTTATVSEATGPREPRPAAVAKLLAASVDNLCELPEAGACTTSPVLKPREPVPVAAAPGMLAEVDLPPIGGIEKPWVGTEPRKALDNAAATGCDQTDFTSKPMSNNLTRTFLVPEATLPDSFGLTETVGTLPEKEAKAFVTKIRDQLASCGKTEDQMGTDVRRLRHEERDGHDLSVWHVSTEISDDQTVDFLMGVVRDGTAVAQVGFVPDDESRMTPEAFGDLVERALDRLGEMPPPRRS